MKNKGFSMLGRDILIGLAILGLIILVVLIIVGVLFFIRKGIGVLLILFGIFMMVFFPDLDIIQPAGFTKTGILAGLIMIILGILIVIYL